uniref:Uncharacterized protein n=1 Tax=Rhizophora mucronata TaxID=61149 RepID=A0A2P2MA61_RHIMU
MPLLWRRYHSFSDVMMCSLWVLKECCINPVLCSSVSYIRL